MALPTDSQTVSFLVGNEQFLRAIFGDRWGEALVAYFPGDPDPLSLNPLINWSAHLARYGVARMLVSDNTYYSVSLPRPGGGRGSADFGALYAIVIDDYKVKVDADKVNDLMGRLPNYIIETSPGNYHAGWFTEPLSDQAWVRGFLRALYEALGRTGDNLVKTTTYVRLPVGTNGKGGLNFRAKLTRWQPGPGYTYTDYIDIEKRIGQITPVAVSVSLVGAMPDPAELEADLVLEFLRDRGMVLGQIRKMTFGWGFDIECPWAAEHTDPRRDASYVPGKGFFKCHHGHCQDKHYGELRDWIDSWLVLEGDSLARRDFEDYIAPPGLFVSSLAGGIDLWEEKTPPAWPGRVLPGPIEDLLAELARRDGLDLGALGATTITAASGASDKRALLTPYAGSPWNVPGVLWLMLIAEPGLRKTAVLGYLLSRLRRLNAARMRQYAGAMSGWRALPTAQRQQQPAPTVRALLAEDTTIEKLQEWMAQNPRGMLYLRDELASLFDFGRYSSGPGAAERANFLEFYEGGPTTIGRMTRTTTIDNCALSIIGGIQPHRLADFKGLADDGLLPRFGTLVMQSTGAGSSDSTPLDLKPIDDMIDRLMALGPDYYQTDAAGEALIRETEQDARELAARPDIGIGHRGFLRKLHGSHARAALVLHLMDGGQDQIVPASTVERAARYAVFLSDHADVFYAGLPGSADNIARAIGGHLLRHPVDRITAGRLRSDVPACRSLRSLKEIQDAVFLLVIGGWLLPETNYPSNNAWRVRPGLGDQFAERTIAELTRAETVKTAMNRQGRYR